MRGSVDLKPQPEFSSEIVDGSNLLGSHTRHIRDGHCQFAGKKHRCKRLAHLAVHLRSYRAFRG